MSAPTLLHRLFGRLIGLNATNDLVFRGRYIFYGDDTGPTAPGQIDLTNISGGGGSTPLNSVTATIPAGPQDNYQPAGWQTGVTNRLILTPTDSTSILLGFPAGADDWGMEIFCPPASPLPIRLENNASGTAGNSIFNGQGSNGIVDILPGTGILLVTVTALNGWLTR